MLHIACDEIGDATLSCIGEDFKKNAIFWIGKDDIDCGGVYPQRAVAYRIQDVVDDGVG